MQLGPERIGKAGIAIIVFALAGAVALSVSGYSAKPGVGAQLAGGSTGSKGVSASPRAGAHNQDSRTQVSQTVGPPLASQPYAKSAYLVYPPPVSSQASLALAGFTFRVTRPSADAMTVVLRGPGGKPSLDRTYPAGDKVYVVELASGDDANDRDYNSSDDGYVVTDKTGRIVR